MGHVLASSTLVSQEILQMNKWFTCGLHCIFLSAELELTLFKSIYYFAPLHLLFCSSYVLVFLRGFIQRLSYTAPIETPHFLRAYRLRSLFCGCSFFLGVTDLGVKTFNHWISLGKLLEWYFLHLVGYQVSWLVLSPWGEKWMEWMVFQPQRN
jgi:hypothetical protein